MDMILLISTVDNKDTANKIASELVEKKLAACVSIFPIESTYFWEGKIYKNEKEYMLLIKTIKEKASELISWLKKIHPYDVPEIITINAKAYEGYTEWMFNYLKNR